MYKTAEHSGITHGILRLPYIALSAISRLVVQDDI